MTEQLYAHPVSQPALHWLCKLNDYAIEYKFVNVVKGETHTEEFKEINPMGKIPVLKDGLFVLTESHAIMIYLAEKHSWTAWYPSDPQIRARQIHEYMNWHHHYARRSSELFVNTLKSKIGQSSPAVEAVLKRKDRTLRDIFQMMEHWLRQSNGMYLLTSSHPSLADLSCYSEVAQLEAMGLLKDLDLTFPRVAVWLKRMKQLPHHDEQFAAMLKFFRKFDLVPAKL
ncbi:hypothetical protein P43SY_002010 [Pythium insidiosum]|uniref:Glutathione S-transferase n=1 Tax=Pythium insidiosum TaxID=114742 RepID=A0AAD5M4Q9_PYTIN|nr:hypothetical protein P43SY_002010 [Pythium insidiosum]KAJ0406482.1 hypothetical protein ATCC90586_000323 [Pythium insidiosum]